MKESIEMQNEFEDIIQELKKLKSTNENLNDFKELMGLAAESLIEVDKKTIELFQQSQLLIGRIDKFIEKYQLILDEQIDDLKREIRDLKKLLKELDLEGIVTSAKTELIDTLNAKTETLLAKLANLDTALQTVLAQTDATHQLCSKEFPVLSEKIQQEANKAKENYLEPIKTNTKSIIGTLSKVDERITTAINEIEYIKKEISITHQLTKVILNDVDEVKANQLKNQKLIEIIKQQTSNLELRSDHISTKIDISQKAQRLQFMILMATVIVFGIVLILK